jgi:hypothetical protein
MITDVLLSSEYLPTLKLLPELKSKLTVCNLTYHDNALQRPFFITKALYNINLTLKQR